MRRNLLPAAAVLVLVVALGAAHAETYSKTFLFKPGVNLEVAEDIGNGLRLESIRFDIADEDWGTLRASASVSNLGEESRMFSIGIALLDESGRLLAAGNGGPKLFPLRAERQGPFRVSLAGFPDEAASATQFKIVISVFR